MANWDAQLYDEKHAFVSKYGSELIELLAPKKGEEILDIGCGTGDLAKELYEQGIHVVGIDKSETMIQKAIHKYPHLTFRVENAINLTYKNKFDAAFSNATLHWVTPPQQALSRIYDSLKTGGRFVAEFGGKGNVSLVTNEIANQLRRFGIPNPYERFPWYFPSIAEYATLMEEAGFQVTFAMHFDRPTPLDGEKGLRNWMEMFAGSMFEGISEDTKAIIFTNIENTLKDILFINNSWIADYKRIRVVGWKA